MDERAVVTAFLRNDGEVLLLRRSDAVGSYQGRWGGVAGHVADASGEQRDPETAARAEIAEETGLADAVRLVTSGDPFPVEDADRDTRWVVHPFLFDCDSRAVETNEETTETAWVHPPEILRRETVPRLWTAYDRVRPRVATVRDDRTRGSAWLSVRALEALRDEAALATEGRTDELESADRDGDDWTALASLARGLRDARPSMAVLANRVNRVMLAASDERTPEAVETATRRAIGQAVDADREAAELAARALPDRVATLSRSGTVETAIRMADPEAVLVAESRPGGEGVGVAESLADATAVTLTTDAALAFELDDWDADAVLVGADRVLPDGRVVNKAGTRGAALAATEAGAECLIVASSDKVAATADYDLEHRDAAEVYDGDADLAVVNPTFDVTPADAVTAVVTEQGRLNTAEVEAVAAAHREWATWDDAQS
ncbi:NUDIX domain-containing protein [Haloarcula pellucida]|uniref:Translation initiation factor 2B subunit alpha n=1 Tax=Haloarcula pellucida TaxID=1427151 RepID=A0A830GPI9_9EURY|nr:NUDIX domain-containing protein [Halomicroarcula pellucida]MBX0349073.1 NUDIX domain-containing protein [Halomicroarcula pellucida]GGN98867.1 translation initiation factor 2B subunit alpha [Halomicroarcula pellucida]